MKQRGLEITHRFWNYTCIRIKIPAVFDTDHGRDFFPHFCFRSCVVIHDKMTLKSSYLMKNFESFSENSKKKLLNGHWNVPAIQQRSVGLHAHWTMPEIRISVNIPWAFNGHSEIFQLTTRRLFILFWHSQPAYFFLKRAVFHFILIYYQCWHLHSENSETTQKEMEYSVQPNKLLDIYSYKNQEQSHPTPSTHTCTRKSLIL